MFLEGSPIPPLGGPFMSGPGPCMSILGGPSLKLPPGPGNGGPKLGGPVVGGILPGLPNPTPTGGTEG